MKKKKDDYWHSFQGRKAMVSGIGMIILMVLFGIITYLK